MELINHLNITRYAIKILKISIVLYVTSSNTNSIVKRNLRQITTNNKLKETKQRIN
jgi:hypothetical protein